MEQRVGQPPPKYRQLADRLRKQIKDGDFPVGTPLPAREVLAADSGFSVGTVEGALRELRKDGLIETLHGSGSTVLRAEPLPGPEADLGRIAGELEVLRDRLGRVESGGAGQELAESVARIEGNLMDLYAKLGFNYPREHVAGDRKAAAP